ncbi:MAG: hypothetical protein LBQ12_01185 [Deltaproteobacteria bacterium]|nr:hypothetical protein [Deltaproteobacteria bacterium]
MPDRYDPLPENFKASASLDELGHAALTSFSPAVNLTPFEGLSWADGRVFFDVDVDDLA